MFRLSRLFNIEHFSGAALPLRIGRMFCNFKLVFVGKEIDGFELRQINHLRSELKQGYAAGMSL